MTDFQITPGPQVSLPDGAPGVELQVFTAEPNDEGSYGPAVDELLATGRAIEIGKAPGLHLAAVEDEDLVAVLNDAKADEIVKAVGNDPDMAARVLEAEQARDKPRKTVIEPLEAIKEPAA